MVPEVKNVSAGEVVVRLDGVGKCTSLGIVLRSSWKSVTPASGILPLIWMMVLSAGHELLTLRTFETDIVSPIKHVAEEICKRYSISLSTSRVVQGHNTTPERRHAVAIDHHSGSLGNIRIHVSPC